MSTMGNNLFAAYWQQRKIPVPLRGLLYYDSLTHVGDGKPDFSTLGERRLAGDYTLKQEVVGGVSCVTNVDAVNEGYLYGIIWNASSVAPGRTSAMLFNLGTNPSVQYEVQPIGMGRIALTNSDEGVFLPRMRGYSLLWNVTQGKKEWSESFTKPTTGEWHLQVMTVDSVAGTFKLWLDKILVGAKNYNNAGMARTGIMNFGNDMPANEHLAHLCIYDHAFTQSEVNALYDILMPTA